MHSMKLITYFPYYLSQIRELSHLLGARFSGRTCFGYEEMVPYFQGRVGLEFGGPSSLFSSKHLIPIYDIAARIDNCNFAEQTLWSTGTGSDTNRKNSGVSF